jgi:hypothetical protein
VVVEVLMEQVSHATVVVIVGRLGRREELVEGPS